MTAALVLAAGRSSRMGTHKLLLPLGGRPVVAHVVDAAFASTLRPIVVVVGYQATTVRQSVEHPALLFVENASYADGLSSSLRVGIEALPPSVPGVVIALGDQPGVTSAHFDSLARMAAETGAPIVVSLYAGRRGNPVYFARTLFDELCAVAGDSGGRQVIVRHSTLVRELAFDDPTAGEDLDTPADYERTRRHWQDHPPHTP